MAQKRASFFYFAAEACNRADGISLLATATVNNGQDSGVRVATRYGLDGPAMESWWGRDFPHPSRPTLGPTQSPIQ